jgi:hypothetical protein
MLGRFARSSLTSAFAAVRAPAAASAFGPSSQSSLLQLQAKRRLTGLVVGVPKESLDGELRVALAPESVKKLKKAGVTVKIQVRGHSDGCLSLSLPFLCVCGICGWICV